ncbi:UPF0261-domain-containing protein [Athelia psychrophila]|uniref:UPF0261-domain-containing protein n=1 Tax=Athelia psychrophila TaxID=1759441 RepID=A0A166BKB5_9AGAM|nr:UPF0261-domain-containing protein [Fibularhizoctonia sp. CBS 109695]
MTAMTAALGRTLIPLHSEGTIAGVIGAGGSGNTTVCTSAFRDALPIGFPKLMVSTMASGDVSCYVGESDVTMMYSVVDVAGMNDILEVILGNAARAIAGMAFSSPDVSKSKSGVARPAVAISMFGVTTPCVQRAAELLEELGYATVVFHATGAGGKAMERLIAERKFVAVLDLTTTELADEFVGGVLTAGPSRLEAASKAGIMQVVSVGALDMVNFGPASTVPETFKGRLFHEHNASVTLMRTTPEECTKLGEILARKLNSADAQHTRVILPLKGVSMIDNEGASFWDPAADNALFEALKNGVKCPVVEVHSNINDPEFAEKAVSLLHEMVSTNAK